MIEKKVGMRVHVWSPDKKEDWGLGTITKIEPLDIEEDDGTVWRLLENYTAEITLDDGRKTEGMHCWWTIVLEMFESMNPPGYCEFWKQEIYIDDMEMCNRCWLPKGLHIFHVEDKSLECHYPKSEILSY